MLKKTLCLSVVFVLLISTFSIGVFADNKVEFSVENIRMTYKDTGEYAFSIVAGKTINITADVIKNNVSDNKISLAACLYTQDNIMLGMRMGEATEIGINERKTLNVEYVLPSGVNNHDNYLKVYVLELGDKLTIFNPTDGSHNRLPNEQAVTEETTHITVHNEKGRELKGVGTSYESGVRLYAGAPRYKEAYELIHTDKGTNFNMVRLWCDLYPENFVYDTKNKTITFSEEIRSFESAYIESGLIEDIEKITNGNARFIITQSSVLPAEFMENAIENIVLSPTDATQLRNITVEDGKFTSIKNGGSAVFENINAPQNYWTVKVDVASGCGGQILISDADTNKVIFSVDVEATGDNSQLYTIILPRKANIKGIKNLKLTFNSNGEEFGTVSEMTIDGNENIKTSKVPEYAEMMAELLNVIKKKHGVEIDYLATYNEPLFKFTTSQLRLLVKELRKQLDVRGLNNVKIVADEWAEVDEYTVYAWEELLKDKEAVDVIDAVSFHNYKTGSFDNKADVKELFKDSDIEFWMTESSVTGLTMTLENGGKIKAAEQAAKMLNDLNNEVDYWVHFRGIHSAPYKSGSDTTAIVSITKKDEGYLMTNDTYDYYKHIMNTFDYGSVFRNCTSTEYGDMSRPRGKKSAVNVAFAQRSDGKYALAVINSSQIRYISEGWDKQNDNPFAVIENIEVFVEELADVDSLEFDVYRSGKSGAYIYEDTVTVKNGRVNMCLEDLDMVTLISK